MAVVAFETLEGLNAIHKLVVLMGVGDVDVAVEPVLQLHQEPIIYSNVVEEANVVVNGKIHLLVNALEVLKDLAA